MKYEKLHTRWRKLEPRARPTRGPWHVGHVLYVSSLISWCLTASLLTGSPLHCSIASLFASLFRCLTAPLPHWHTALLPDCLTAPLSRRLNCLNVPLPRGICSITSPLHCSASSLPHCSASSLPHCSASSLPHCSASSLPHCLIARPPLGHCPTASPL